jgi:hypothetical protein
MKGTSRRLRRCRSDNINMVLKEVLSEDVDFIHLA